jgi:TRAP-type C4-dicarboxylate transport system permease small subunit
MKSVVESVNALAWLIERVLAVALLVGICLNFVNVLGRYLFGVVLNGVDEIEIYILIWIAFLGAATVTWRGLHLRMDVLINACPTQFRLIVAAFETIVFVVVAGFVAWQSFRYVERIYALGAVSDIAHIPTWIPHSAIPISFSLMALLVLLRAIQRLLGIATEGESLPEGGRPS